MLHTVGKNLTGFKSTMNFVQQHTISRRHLVFSFTTPGMEETSNAMEDNLVASGDDISTIDDFDFEDMEDSYDDFDDVEENPYEEEYGDLSDEWLDDCYEDNLRMKFSRSARNNGDW